MSVCRVPDPDGDRLMAELWELTSLIRSKNAGPFELTFDVIMRDRDSYERVLSSEVLDPEAFAHLNGIPAGDVKVAHQPSVYAVKLSIPGLAVCGDVDDTDVFGGQFHSPLVRLDVPNGAGATKESR
jgi:hypothetical protein